MRECCEDMEDVIKEEDIGKIGGNYFIYAKPRFVNDGGGYYDDMTDSLEINYCPFCGKKINKVGE